jgi:DNA (cytosine-5)-methyltransferase 1
MSRAPEIRLFEDEIIVDNFAGGGGASTGIEWATGRSPDIAINHDAQAVAMHAVNHPRTRHIVGDIWDQRPREVCAGRPVGLAWFSPDCKHFSKAKGGKPVEKKIRGLAWVVIRWAREVKPRIIMLENVEEFADWGPLLNDGKPCPARRGLTFRRWLGSIKTAGYAVEYRELRASDYGAPTIRKRLIVIARRDGQPIVWPTPTHGRGLAPYRTAADCIDWTLACPSIFERSKPLADKTLRRVARGVVRYVIEAAQPFIVPVTHGGDDRVHSIAEPLRTITGAHRGEHALVVPTVISHYGESVGRAVTEPLPTITAGGMGHQGLASATLIQTGYGERPGQAPRVPGLDKPLGTIMGGGCKHALVSAFLAKHYGGVTGQSVQLPLGTVTTVDHHSVVAAHMLLLHGSRADGQPVERPLPTVRAGGTHLAEVRAFLTRYNGDGENGLPRAGQSLTLPFGTLTTARRFGLVTVHGEEYAISDIGLRMLTPRELFRAQGFPDTYVIDPVVNGKPLTKEAQVRMCGNSVSPVVARALVEANLGVGAARRVA